MLEQRRYEALVRSWMGRAPSENRDLTIAVFETGMNALWRRAHLTIGDQPLRAVVGEILQDAAARFPALAPVKLNGGSGILVNELRERARREDTQQLREGTRWVMVQFLVFVARLTTDEIALALEYAGLPAQADQQGRDGEQKTSQAVGH